MRLERVNGMEFDAYDLVRQISNTYCELATLKETHRRSLQIIEEKRAEIWQLESENADLKKQISELKGLTNGN
jgi:cell shape-determining protein MreC